MTSGEQNTAFWNGHIDRDCCVTKVCICLTRSRFVGPRFCVLRGIFSQNLDIFEETQQTPLLLMVIELYFNSIG